MSHQIICSIQYPGISRKLQKRETTGEQERDTSRLRGGHAQLRVLYTHGESIATATRNEERYIYTKLSIYVEPCDYERFELSGRSRMSRLMQGSAT
jgi:hypothetical protein